MSARYLVYEHKHEQPVSRARFAVRMAWHLGIALMLAAASLAAGMLGYIAFEHLAPIDAFLNTAMLLGGMGPVDMPKTADGKLFAGSFALYAGLVFIVSAALVVAPILHRVIHHFHWDEKA